MALCPNAKDQISSVSICSSEGCQIRTFTANEAMRAESVIGYASSASGNASASMRSGASHRIKPPRPAPFCRTQCPFREAGTAWWSGAAEPRRFPGLQLSQPHLIDRMIFALAQDETGAGASGQNIVAQIDHVDPLPNPLRGPGGLRIGEPAIAMEVRTRILKRCAAQVEKALDVPLANDGLV